jgi:hypothetical protein
MEECPSGSVIQGTEYLKQGEQLMWIIYDKEKQLRSKEEVHHLGHEGVYKTYNRPKRDFYWGNMKRNIQ